MNYVKSCGFIAFKRVSDEILYLIITSNNGDIGFPKGHMEENETELETAVRELKEETNIDVKPISGFREEINYALPAHPNTRKISVYFLGECISEQLLPQEAEVKKAEFLPYETALTALTFSETMDILAKANEYINSSL